MTEEEKSGQPPKKEPESGGNDVGSLSDFIAERLHKRGQSVKQQPTETFVSSETYLPQTANQFNKSGAILHHLDSQLVNNHLERYLPNPATRLHLSKERLEQELKHIYDELWQYRQFAGNEYQSKIEALESRVRFLQRKIFDLDQKIAKLNPFQNMVSKLKNLVSNSDPETGEPKNGSWTFITNPQGQVRNEVGNLNQELQSMQSILSEQLHDPCFTPDQLGRLISQYDANLAKAERLMEELKKRKTLSARVTEAWDSWFRPGSGNH